MLGQVNAQQFQPACLDTFLPYAPPAIISPEWASHFARKTRAGSFEPPQQVPNITPKSWTSVSLVLPSPNVEADSIQACSKSF
jgi:hypothetical protein